MCEIPPLPDLRSAAPVVVGDGTPESCTESALQNALRRGAHIRFSCGPAPVVIRVTKPLVVRDRTFIEGGGRIILDGQNNTPIMITEPQTTVVIDGLVFQNGRADCGGALGKGWQGTLFVRDSTFLSNRADGGPKNYGGGAIHGGGGRLILLDCRFAKNRGVRLGGAIHTILCDLFVVNSIFEDNEGGDCGGAIFTDGGRAESPAVQGTQGGVVCIRGSLFRRNQADGAGAGYLYTYFAQGKYDRVFVDRCEFSDNKARTPNKKGWAGAIEVRGDVRITRSLFTGNSTGNIASAVAFGDGMLAVEDCVFFGNPGSAAVWADGLRASIANCWRGGGDHFHAGRNTVLTNVQTANQIPPSHQRLYGSASAVSVGGGPYKKLASLAERAGSGVGLGQLLQTLASKAKCGDPEEAAEAAMMIEALRASGQASVEAAVASAEVDPNLAVARLDRLARQYAGDEIGAAAGEAAGLLRQNPKDIPGALHKARARKGAAGAPVQRRSAPDGLLAAWDAKLKARIREDLDAQRRTDFLLTSLQMPASIAALEPSGALRLLFSQGGGASSHWDQLKPEDKRNLAEAFAKSGDRRDLLLAVFYCLASGARAQAEKYTRFLPRDEALKEILSAFE